MMKQLFILMLLLNFGIYSCCNSNQDVPEKAISTFTEMFPDAKNVEWEMEDENEWEAEFELDGKEIYACFTSGGEWLETEWVVEMDELPDKVLASVKKDFDEWEIDEVEFVETPDFVGFEIEMENGEKEMELLVTSSGEIVGIEKEDGSGGADED